MRYREHLPQLDGGLWLTDGGLETTLVFHDGIDLPEFAAFPLLADEGGRERLRDYYRRYLAIAQEHRLGFVLEAPTWRANPRWAARLGYDEAALDRCNRAAIELIEELRDESGEDENPIVLSGCIGPQDDGYNPAVKLCADEAREYHSTQISTFADTAADMVNVMTMTYAEEAIGVVRAAAEKDIPAAVSFTVETDGRLASGQPLGEAIAQTEEETGGGAVYYSINCAHPTHFEGILDSGNGWREKIVGMRANASTKSHAELDEAEELDDGDPADLGERYAALRSALPRLSVIGGCCGTDERHVAAACRAMLAEA